MPGFLEPVNDDATVTFEVSFTVPERGTAVTRAFGEKPDYTDLHLYLAEFDLVGTPLDNGKSNVYLAQEETPTPPADPAKVVFKVTLNQTSDPKVLHLIAVPKDVDLSFGDYGMEGNIIPALATTGGDEAYWQRLEFPRGYGEMTKDADGKETWTVLQEAKDKLTMVPMIRNFAQVTVQLSEELQEANKFVLEGYTLLNIPTFGSIAPWDNREGYFVFPEFLNANNQQKDYSEMDYTGLTLGEISKYDAAESDFTNTPSYLYERRYTSVNHTQLIIKGNYNNLGSSYYKIDLGLPHDGKFDFFNLLRNFNYVVTITDVAASGYDNATDAKNGVVYNNLSFDLDTQKMLNISNGSDMIWVNFTTAVVTQDTDAARTLKFAFRYKTGITGANGGTTDNKEEYVKGLEPGNVIESVTRSTATNPNDSTDWMFYEIKTKAPKPTMETQSFVVVNNETGLGRTINLILTDPWVVTDQCVYGRNYNTDFPTNNNELGVVGDQAADPLTIFFNLPNYLPEAIFPLSFLIESDMQNIENNPQAEQPVTYGTSSFSTPDNPIVGRRIKFIKTVTWSDYNTALSESYPTGLLVPDPTDVTKELHRVRCRFQTITSLSNLGIEVGQSVTSTVRITNPYFTAVGGGYIDVQFTRTRTN